MRWGIGREFKFSLMLLCAALVGPASADLIGIYEFTGTPTGDNQFNEVTQQPSTATFSTFTRRNPLQFLPGPNIFNSGSWNRFNPMGEPGYTRFFLTPNGDSELLLDTLSFDFGRTMFGPTSGEVQYSTDGFQTFQSIQFFDISTPTVAGNTAAVETSSSSGSYSGSFVWGLDGLEIDASTPIEFRFYGFGATLNKGSLWFDNVAVTASIVPLPDAALLGAFGLGTLIWVRRKRNPVVANS